MTDKTPQHLIKLYQELYEITRPKCAECRAPLSCCSSEYCHMAEQIASACGVTLERTDHPTLPFMGEKGCIVPPHLRPLCTRHVCSINSLGYDLNDIKFTERWFELTTQIDEVENELPRV